MFRRIGLRDYVIETAEDTDLFRKACDLGFGGVELGPTRGQLNDPGKTRLGSLRKSMEETGLLIPSLSLNHHNQGGLGSEDESIRQAAIQDVRLCFDWAKNLGSSAFLIPFFGAASLQEPAARARALEAFGELCGEAASRGILLAYEGDLPASEILLMAKELQAPSFGCYFDLANPLFLGRDPVAELKLLRELVVSVHIKDFRTTLGDCRPGEGRVPLEECAATLREIGYDGWLILETPPASAGVVAGDYEFVERTFCQ